MVARTSSAENKDTIRVS